MIKFFNITFLIFTIFLSSCSKVRDSAGVSRKSLDEFQVIENPPLVLPPDFNLIPPDQLKQKNIDEVDKDLAQEILFGLNEENEDSDEKSSTMNQILIQSEADNISTNIREEIDQEFSQEKKTFGIINSNWNNEEEIFDAIEKSECLRNSKIENDLKEDCIISNEKQKIKKKKKFFFF